MKFSPSIWELIFMDNSFPPPHPSQGFYSIKVLQRRKPTNSDLHAWNSRPFKCTKFIILEELPFLSPRRRHYKLKALHKQYLLWRVPKQHFTYNLHVTFSNNFGKPIASILCFKASFAKMVLLEVGGTLERGMMGDAFGSSPERVIKGASLGPPILCLHS